MYQRRSGILLHPTSLPGPHGVGDLGSHAYQFVDFLAASSQRVWQVLPLGPAGVANSPYDGRSTYAGNPLLIAVDPLADSSLLEHAEIPSEPLPATTQADYSGAAQRKDSLLRRSFERFQQQEPADLRADFDHFVAEQRYWLDDYALYQAIHDAQQGRPWYQWDEDLLRRDPDVLATFRSQLDQEIAYHEFCQYLFDRQWTALKRYANERGITIVGDIPIYVAHDSADVWANQELFTLDEYGQPTVVAGVPPDYFSETGQLWGNPCYRWDVLARTGYQWWIRRFQRMLHLCDVIRVDHFRGFQAGWQVPAGEETAQNGTWVPGPGIELFHQVAEEIGSVPVIVEDLGIITPDVHALREQLGYPGMKVLQFAFGSGDDNPYLPHNYERNTVVYTGTHDNDTTLGWVTSCSDAERSHVLHYLGTDGGDIVRAMIRLALASVADLAIVPMQDVLGLGSEARMNRPGVAEGNWRWRYPADSLVTERAHWLREMTHLYGRAG